MRTPQAPSERRRQAHCRDSLLHSLHNDHQVVRRLFRQLRARDAALDDETREQLVHQLCALLTQHARLEAATLYPAVAACIDDPLVIEQAMVEHASAASLVEQLRTIAPGQPRHGALLRVLDAYVHHHMGAEEKQMFPMLMRLPLNWHALLDEAESTRARLSGSWPDPAGGDPSPGQAPALNAR